MVTILLEQILELLKGWLSSFTTWAEGVATNLGLIEEATEYIDDIYDDTTAIRTDTGNIATSNQIIVSNTQGINNRLQSIDPNVTAIKNNVGTISTNTGIAAAFSEDIATNTMNTLDKVTTIASDTTQLRADNAVVKSDLDKIYDALKWSLVGIDTTETEEGIGSVSFNTDKTDPLNQFDIAFTAVQSGSGDPSPDNVRPITGWTDFDVTANDSILNIDLNGTYYGGVVDCITGKITLTHKKVVIDDQSTITIASNQSGFLFYTSTGESWIKDENQFTNMGLEYFSAASSLYSRENCFVLYANGTAYFKLDTATNTVALVKAFLANNPLEILAELATPIEVYASNVLSINTQKGLNTITSDSNGTMTVTYTESVKHYLDKQEG
ncbi:MAG: hypothetical protein J6S67_24625 [Methanobrevibacter sp.]|nr:hypothetical protein [Methanobrevibacter sp.]